MGMKNKFDNEFYTVEYELMGETKFACYFQLESAQEAMMKMIKNGMVVKGLETKSIKQSCATCGTVHNTPPKHRRGVILCKSSKGEG